MSWKLKVLGAGCWVLGACASAAQAVPAAMDNPVPGPQYPAPRLIVLISVDQMRGDYLQRFGTQLTGGLGRLAREGAVYTHAFQDHAMTETAPGHATLLSGRYPRSTGIVRNDEGVPDSSYALVGARGAGASPARFKGTTLFDWMQRTWPSARALSVSRKDRSAILMVGRAPQSVYWYVGGTFTTSRYYADSLPAWLRDFNRGALAARAGTQEWTTVLPASAYPEADSLPYENGGMAVAFPHRFPADSAGHIAAFNDSPYIDSLTLALALEGVGRLRLGAGPGPDLLAVGLSQTDRIGHAWGPDSRELRDQILHLDRWLGVFLDSLAKLSDPAGTVIVVSSDHGITSFPEFARDHGSRTAQWVRTDTVIERWRRVLETDWGPGRWIKYFDTGMLALDRAGLAAKGADVDVIVERMRRDFARLPGVLRVDTRASIASPDTTGDWNRVRWHRAIPDDSPGEIFITPRQGNLFGAPRASTTHGSPGDLDASVTLVLHGAAFRAAQLSQRASTVDIAPTLAHLLGVTPDSGVQGRVLHEALK